MLGLVGLLFAFIPVVGVIAWPLTILGVIFGVVGITRANKGEADNKGMAITAVVLSAIGLVICVVWTVAFGAAVKDAADDAPHGGRARGGSRSGGHAWQHDREVRAWQHGRGGRGERAHDRHRRDDRGEVQLGLERRFHRALPRSASGGEKVDPDGVPGEPRLDRRHRPPGRFRPR
ncbi:DUF4190 domain-containing protein [Amycolatopsis sp. NPDC001319]|uniref:DUF4190 domain-containing protein n=1 Tax=unclassified Amycolatopsis TaxID=2618356 RepID=UPI0036921A8C